MVPYCILNFYFLLMNKGENTTLCVKKHLHFYVGLIFALFLYFYIFILNSCTLKTIVFSYLFVAHSSALFICMGEMFCVYEAMFFKYLHFGLCDIYTSTM